MTELTQKLMQAVLEKDLEAGELLLDVDAVMIALDRTHPGWKNNERRMIQMACELRPGDVSWIEYFQTLFELVQQERRGISGQGH